jgi:hypothetical protein
VTAAGVRLYAGRKGWLSEDGTTVRAHVIDLTD